MKVEPKKLEMVTYESLPWPDMTINWYTFGNDEEGYWIKLCVVPPPVMWRPSDD